MKIMSAWRFVAPLVGAWIEIMMNGRRSGGLWVAPLVGAWIEILMTERASSGRKVSLLSWERGLKYA